MSSFIGGYLGYDKVSMLVPLTPFTGSTVNGVSLAVDWGELNGCQGYWIRFLTRSSVISIGL